MKDDVLGSGVSRRSTLKTIGAVGAFSLAGFAGTAAAKNEEKNYGNGNGLGAWLNEPAEFKDSPLWTDGVHDYTGMSNVTVITGAMTSINIPGVPFPAAPVAFAPQAIKVSPGTTVTFEWIDAPDTGFPFAVPHNVVSLREDGGVPEFAFPGKFDFVAYDSEGDANSPPYVSTDPVSFDHTFHERGNHLYYCTPHGAPFEVTSGPTGEPVFNEFGMRGAVKVTGKPL